MEFIPKDLNEYTEKHTSPESTLLSRLNRETYLKANVPRMISGHFQGRLLSMLSKLVQPTTILEIGTYTGYSALCLAEGLREGGKLITIDINEELEEMVSEFVQEAGFKDKIDCRIGAALDIIPTLEESFDLVFIDADKSNYSNYYDLAFPKVKKGGLIVVDNVLWSAKVLQESPDDKTEAIMALNDKIQNDDRVENVLLPVRDGMMVVRKI